MLKLMYITNRPEIAQIAESAGVDRIFVDMEYIGKGERQRGLDTVKSHHTVRDVAAIKAAVEKAEVLVRVNPIHEATPDYPSSRDEIDATVAAGADIIMLPFFKTREEVQTFLELVGGRTRTMLLLETPEAVERIDEILTLPGIDEVHIGLNDLSLGYGLPFMWLRGDRLPRQRNAALGIHHPGTLPSGLRLRDPLAELLRRDQGAPHRHNQRHVPQGRPGDSRSGGRLRAPRRLLP